MIEKNIRNIGIFAHVDAGKTTLTENILYCGGSIKYMGRVDEGTAHTDSMDIERQRGISVTAAAASVKWKGMQINIIDTPGHVDFTAEVERSLMVLDGAILVISAVEGVQSQTDIIWRALREMDIPTIIFINKIDRAGSNIQRVLEQIEKNMTKAAIPIQYVIGEGDRAAKIFEINKTFNTVEIDKMKQTICEKLADYDNRILENIVDNIEMPNEEIFESFSSLSKEGKVFPVFLGSALKGLGIEPIIDGVANFLPAPFIKGSDETVAVAYKIRHGKYGGKAVHLRLYEGRIWVKGTIFNHTRNKTEKINGIFKVNGSEYEPVDILEAGEIGLVSGLESTVIGDVFGNPEGLKRKAQIAFPTLTVRVQPARAEQLDNMVAAFQRLEEEDPLLSIKWLSEERELHVSLMGMVQMEILTGVIKARFDLDVIFEKPSVIYKEAPMGTGTGYVSMTSPYFATLEMKIEPMPSGSGVIIESQYTTDFIFPRFQNEVLDAAPQVLKEGNYGWEVTDAKVSIIGGRSIQLATKPSDFRAVTPIALMDAIKAAGTRLLEPIQEYEIRVIIEDGGVVIGEIMEMRGTLEEQLVDGDFFIFRGVIPVATSMRYALRLTSLSQGRASIATKFIGYKECTLELGAVRQRKTVDPSDRAQYLASISTKGMKDRAANNSRG